MSKVWRNPNANLVFVSSGEVGQGPSYMLLYWLEYKVLQYV